MVVRNPLEILIFGTGAVGSMLGWRLAQHTNTRITAICRSNYDVVKHHPILVSSQLWGNGQFRPDEVLRSCEDLGDRKFDYVICSNKACTKDTSYIQKELYPAISERTTLVSAQNGVDVEAPLHAAFPNHTILSAICYISCIQPTPGVVQQVSNIRPHAFHVGVYKDDENDDNQEVLQQFVSLDSRFRSIQDVQVERWTKQVFNGAWNPVCAISGLDTHSVLVSSYAHMVHQMASELYNVALNLGVPLPDNLPQKTMEAARNSPTLVPSMLQDVRTGRPMEVDSLCGSICRLAGQIGVPTPTVDQAYRQLLQLGVGKARRIRLRPNSQNMDHVNPRIYGTMPSLTT